MDKSKIKAMILGILFLVFGAFSIVSMIIDFSLLYYTYWATLIFCVYSFVAAAALLFLNKLKQIVFHNGVVLSVTIMMLLLIFVVRTSLTPFWEVPVWKYLSYDFFDELIIHFINPIFMISMFFIVKQYKLNYWNILYAIIMPISYSVFMVIDGVMYKDFSYSMFDYYNYPNIYLYSLMLLTVFAALTFIAGLFIFLKNKQQYRKEKLIEKYPTF